MTQLLASRLLAFSSKRSSQPHFLSRTYYSVPIVSQQRQWARHREVQAESASLHDRITRPIRHCEQQRGCCRRRARCLSWHCATARDAMRCVMNSKPTQLTQCTSSRAVALRSEGHSSWSDCVDCANQTSLPCYAPPPSTVPHACLALRPRCVRCRCLPYFAASITSLTLRAGAAA